MSIYRPNLTIPSGTALSNTLEIGDNLVAAVRVPSDWTTADMTFLGSYDGTNFYTLYKYDASIVSLTPAKGDITNVEDMLAFKGVQYIQLRSGTKASPVNQTGDRSVFVYIVEEF